MADVIVKGISLLCLLSLSLAQLDFPQEETQAKECEDVCDNTYPQHTYDKPDHVLCCRRGCRLFSIIDFIEEFVEVNATRQSCAVSCNDAYSETDNRDACILGCNHQTPFFTGRFPRMEPFFQPIMTPNDFFSPLMYLHGIYSNIKDKFSHSVRLSFYIQDGNGQMTVIRSDTPRLNQIIEVNIPDDEYKTSQYLETNLEPVEDSATANFKHAQLRSLEGDLMGQDEIDAKVEDQPTDFLGCIARKAGISRLLLCLTLFLSALVMIWLCLSSAVTAPDQHIKIKPQKLSIYGDLEYLRDGSEKDKSWLLALRPQESNDNAGPFPIKIKVQSI